MTRPRKWIAEYTGPDAAEVAASARVRATGPHDGTVSVRVAGRVLRGTWHGTQTELRIEGLAEDRRGLSAVARPDPRPATVTDEAAAGDAVARHLWGPPVGGAE